MNEKLKAWFASLERDRFYGSVTCKIEGGRVTYVRLEQGFKPDELSNQPGDPRNNGKSIQN